MTAEWAAGAGGPGPSRATQTPIPPRSSAGREGLSTAGRGEDGLWGRLAPDSSAREARSPRAAAGPGVSSCGRPGRALAVQAGAGQPQRERSCFARSGAMSLLRSRCPAEALPGQPAPGFPRGAFSIPPAPPGEAVRRQGGQRLASAPMGAPKAPSPQSQAGHFNFSKDPEDWGLQAFAGKRLRVHTAGEACGRGGGLPGGRSREGWARCSAEPPHPPPARGALS